VIPSAQDVARVYMEPWAVRLRACPPVTADTYTLEILATPTEVGTVSLLYDVRDVLAEAEENITDLLPPGYRARISHWTEAP
jgi:hypothetical protein